MPLAACVAPRKEIRALDDRLTRRIDSDHKEEAANVQSFVLEDIPSTAHSELRLLRTLDDQTTPSETHPQEILAWAVLIIRFEQRMWRI